MNRITGKIKSSTKLRNFTSLIVGGAIGLYFGQYFPDLYWPKVDQYVIELQKKEVNEQQQSMFMPKRPIFTPERISASPDSSVPQKVV